MGTATMPTAWILNELMARYRVKGKDLAEALDISTNAVSSLRNAETMPRIDGTRLDEIAEALSRLSGHHIRGIDLLEDRSPQTLQSEEVTNG
jgi:putative transcriptional regulator